MRIYTGRGDDGMTDLRDMSRVSKASERIEAYGTVDEVNSLVGTVRPTGHDDLDEKLQRVQNHLHIVQAEFANPERGPEPSDEPTADDTEGPPSIREDHIEQLEAWIDEYDEELEPLRSFILPGGGDVGAALHHTRAVCRRAERRAVALAAAESIDETAVQYLNRLSDALFVWARVANARGGHREEAPDYR